MAQGPVPFGQRVFPGGHLQAGFVFRIGCSGNGTSGGGGNNWTNGHPVILGSTTVKFQ